MSRISSVTNLTKNQYLLWKISNLRSSRFRCLSSRAASSSLIFCLKGNQWIFYSKLVGFLCHANTHLAIFIPIVGRFRARIVLKVEWNIYSSVENSSFIHFFEKGHWANTILDAKNVSLREKHCFMSIHLVFWLLRKSSSFRDISLKKSFMPI